MDCEASVRRIIAYAEELERAEDKLIPEIKSLLEELNLEDILGIDDLRMSKQIEVEIRHLCERTLGKQLHDILNEKGEE